MSLWEKWWVANGRGSRRPSTTSRSSVGVERVSTSPVVMVTFRIHSRSRCRVAGWPWTPTLATRPPRRACLLEAGVGLVDGHDRHQVAGLDVAVQHADLETGRENVGQEQHLLVAEPVRQLVEAVVREWDARQLGLGAVDEVPEDPAAAVLALPVHSVPAVLAAPAS